jgi:hypothetical protein
VLPPEFLGETELPIDSNSLTFAELLLAESQVSLDHRLCLNLIDGILDHIQGSIVEQSSYLGHDPRRTLQLFEQWSALPVDPPCDTSEPDGY